MRAIRQTVVTSTVSVLAICLAACESGRVPTTPSPQPQAQTYQLRGQILAVGEPAVPVPGARVEVISGPSVGSTTTSDDEGRYELQLRSGETVLRVTRDGYQPREQAVSGTELDIELTPIDPSSQAGTYMLTIRAAEDCQRVDSTALPESARLRQFTATIKQSGSNLSVILSGASLHVVDDFGSRPRGDRFTGRIERGRALFSLSDDPFDYPWDYSDPYFDVMERLDDSRYVVVGGEASVAVSSLQGRLNGVVGVMGGFNPTTWIAWCSSERHEFTFSH